MSHDVNPAPPTDCAAASNDLSSSSSSGSTGAVAAMAAATEVPSERLRACEEAEHDFLRFAETAAARSQGGASGSCSEAGSNSGDGGSSGGGPSHGARQLAWAEAEVRACPGVPELVPSSSSSSSPWSAIPAASSAECCLGLLIATLEQIASLQHENGCLRQRCDDLESANRLLEVRLQLLAHAEGFNIEGGADHLYSMASDSYSMALQRSNGGSSTGRGRRMAAYKDSLIHDVSWVALSKHGFPEDPLDRGRAGTGRLDGTPMDGSHDKTSGDSVGKFKGTIERVKNRLKGAQPSPKPGAVKRTSSSKSRDGESLEDRESGFVQWEINPPELLLDDYGGVWLGYDESDYGGVWLGPTEVSIPEQNPVAWDPATVATSEPDVAAIVSDAAEMAVSAGPEVQASSEVNMDAPMQTVTAGLALVLPATESAASEVQQQQPAVACPPSVGSLQAAAVTEDGVGVSKEAKAATPPVSPDTKKKKKKASRTSSLATTTTEKLATEVLSASGDNGSAAAGQSWSADARSEPHTRGSPDPYLEALQKVEVTKEFARKYEEWNKRIAKDEVEGADGSEMGPGTKTLRQGVAVPPRSPGAPHRRWSTKASTIQVLPPQLRADKLRNLPTSQSSSSLAAHGVVAATAISTMPVPSEHRSDDGGSTQVWVPLVAQTPDAVATPAVAGAHSSTGRGQSASADRSTSARPAASAPGSDKAKDKGKQSSGRSRFTQRVKRELEKRLTRTREQQPPQRGSARSKSCERPEGKITDDFAEKLREWSVKQGHDPDYYGRMGNRARSTGSVVKEAELAGPAGSAGCDRSSPPQQRLRTGQSDSSLDGIGKGKDAHPVSLALVHHRPSSDASGAQVELASADAMSAACHEPRPPSSTAAVSVSQPLPYQEIGCLKQQPTEAVAVGVGLQLSVGDPTVVGPAVPVQPAELISVAQAADGTLCPAVTADVSTGPHAQQPAMDAGDCSRQVPADGTATHTASAGGALPARLLSCGSADDALSAALLSSLPSAAANVQPATSVGQPQVDRKQRGVAAVMAAAQPALRDSFSELDALVHNVLSSVSSAFRSDTKMQAPDRKATSASEMLAAVARPGGDAFGMVLPSSGRLPSSSDDCTRPCHTVALAAIDGQTAVDLPAVVHITPVMADSHIKAEPEDAGSAKQSLPGSCAFDDGEMGCGEGVDSAVACSPGSDVAPLCESATAEGRCPVPSAIQSRVNDELQLQPHGTELEVLQSAVTFEVCSQEGGANHLQLELVQRAECTGLGQCPNNEASQPEERPDDNETSQPEEHLDDNEASKPEGHPDDNEASQPEEHPQDNEASQPEEHPHDNEASQPKEHPHDNEASTPEELGGMLPACEVVCLPTFDTPMAVYLDEMDPIGEMHLTCNGAGTHDLHPMKLEGPLPGLIASDVTQLPCDSLLLPVDEYPIAGREVVKQKAPLEMPSCSQLAIAGIDKVLSDCKAVPAEAVLSPPDSTSVEESAPSSGMGGVHEDVHYTTRNIDEHAATILESYEFRKKMASLERVRRSLSDSEGSSVSDESDYSDSDPVDSSTAETVSTASEEVLHGSSHHLSTITPASSSAWQCESNRQRSLSMGNCSTDSDLLTTEQRSAAHSLESDASASSDPALLETVNQLDGYSSMHGYSRERLCDRLKALAAEYASEGTRPVEQVSRGVPSRKACLVTESSSTPVSPVEATAPTRGKTAGTYSQDYTHGAVELSSGTEVGHPPMGEKRKYGNSHTMPPTISSSSVGGGTSLKKAIVPRAASTQCVLSTEKTKGTAAAAAVHALVSRFESQSEAPWQQPQAQAQPAHGAPSAACNLPQRTFVSPVSKLKSAAELMTSDAAKKSGVPVRDSLYPCDIPQLCAKRGQGNSGVLSRKGLRP